MLWQAGQSVIIIASHAYLSWFYHAIKSTNRKNRRCLLTASVACTTFPDHPPLSTPFPILPSNNEIEGLPSGWPAVVKFYRNAKVWNAAAKRASGGNLLYKDNGSQRHSVLFEAPTVSASKNMFQDAAWAWRTMLKNATNARAKGKQEGIRHCTAEGA